MVDILQGQDMIAVQEKDPFMEPIWRRTWQRQRHPFLFLV